MIQIDEIDAEQLFEGLLISGKYFKPLTVTYKGCAAGHVATV
jgi:hypothetical protein